jgi:hypothetical protein
LTSCQRYAALREQIAHKATLKLEEPEREKARSPKKKSKSANKKKKKRSSEDYSENYRGGRGEVRMLREARHSSDDNRRWHEVRSSRYE